MKPASRKRLSRVLVISWFALVGMALVFVLLVAIAPNELNAHVVIWPYGVSFVLVAAVLALPLLVAALFLDRHPHRHRP
jgi:hypothetical protein